ncbi:hypothetical protein BDAP_001385 [Binucleata daphniae]
MILVIDSYKIASHHIEKHFKLKNLVKLDVSNIKTKNFTPCLYYIHQEEIQDYSYIRYYFNEIYEIKNEQLLYCNKKKNVYKIYDFVDKKFVKVKQTIQKDPDTKNFDMKNILPYLDAQDDCTVDFPCDEEDEEI